MIMDIGELYSSLVKIKSKFTGSGVWINLGFEDHSYVLTAEHNIDGQAVEVYSHKGECLSSSYIGKLDGLDISIIKIHSRCDNNIDLCLDDLQSLNSDSKCWILGYPKALVKISVSNKAIDHEGTIMFDHGNLFFRIEQGLPDNSEREHIDGFSGGPIIEINNKGNLYLKGIITDSFDDNFSYKRIRGEKISKIYKNFPDQIKADMVTSTCVTSYLERTNLLISQDIDEIILSEACLTSLKSIDLNDLKQCDYFYLPDDRSKVTQHLSLLTNDNSIKSYLQSRIISILLDEGILKADLNPSSFESNNLFTIHITDFTSKHQLTAKLIRQEKSLDYANSTILIIFPNDNNDLKYIKKKKISRLIADYSEGGKPELYSKELPLLKRNALKNFLESRKKAGVTFSIINIKFLVEMIIENIENEYETNELDPDLIKHEVIKVIKEYD